MNKGIRRGTRTKTMTYGSVFTYMYIPLQQFINAFPLGARDQ